ncbi:uncharacterized protein ACN427_009555 isoform 1-T2 [Glossina fuscipes fuscipes]
MSTIFDEELHDVLSRLLRDYPKLWRHRGGPIKGQYQELAGKVSVELQRPVSAQKVQATLQDVRRRLQRLEKGSSSRMRSYAYLWYAEELGYRRAVKALSKLIEQEKGFGAFEEAVVIDQNKKVIEEILIDTATTKTTDTSSGQLVPTFEKFVQQCMEIIDENYVGPSPYALIVEKPPSVQECLQMIDEDCDGPSTSAQAAQMKEHRRLRADSLFRKTATNAEEAAAWVENMDVSKETLKKLVGNLTLQDEIVQIQFDDVFTNRQTVYSRTEDRSHGCGYENARGTATGEHQTVLVFAARSLLTGFSVILSWCNNNGK